MKTWTKVGLGCGAAVALASVGVVLVAPSLLREASCPASVSAPWRS